MDQTVTKQVFTFDTEQHVTIRLRHRDHDRRSLSGAESVFIDDDLHTAVVITEISRGIGTNENISFGFDRRQQTIAHCDQRPGCSATRRDNSLRDRA